MNYRRNEDKWPLREYGFYNAVLGVTRTVANDAVEPVTLAEAKEHLLVTYDDRDAQISALIRRCRRALEDDKWISIVVQSVTAIINNSQGGQPLPYGPVTAVTSMADNLGTAILADNYTVENFAIISPQSDYLSVTYAAGFGTVPENLKQELLELIAWVFFDKGMLAEGLAKISKSNSRRSIIL